MQERITRSNRGFTLIELLIVVAIIGLIAAIAIPNLLNAVDRGKQKRTMADIRSVSTAVESYAVDNTLYPVGNTVSAISASLEPLYIANVPPDDAWGRNFVITSDGLDYTIGSGGKDGGALNVIGGPTSSYNDAIIWFNGQFFQWPEGAQQ